MFEVKDLMSLLPVLYITLISQVLLTVDYFQEHDDYCMFDQQINLVLMFFFLYS